MHELHGQDPPSDMSDKGKQGIRAQPLVVFLFFPLCFVRMARRLSRRVKKEKVLAVRESPRMHCFILYSTTE